AVGAWAMGVLRALTGPDAARGADLRWFAALAGAAAVRSGGAHTVDVPVVGGTVVLPSLGAALVADSPPTPPAPDAPDPLDAAGRPGHIATAELRCASGAGEVRSGGRRVPVFAEPGGDPPGWRPLPRVGAPADGLTRNP